MHTGAQIITTIAGTGAAGYTGDGSAAISATINHPAQIAIDGSGNIYFAETNNNVIRKISTAGIISTVAGTGIGGFSGDGGPATVAQLNGPYGIDIDASGNLYISDFSNNRMRKVSTSGIITTIAGTGTGGYTVDGIAATASELNHPGFFRIDKSGNIFISDNANQRVRKINTSGIISTFAGNGLAGYLGDGGQATAARLYYPDGIWIDSSGNVYIGDAGNNVVRKVNTSGIINTIAGTGIGSFSGDGSAATTATLYTPQALFVDNAGNVYIPDTHNSRIRVVNTSGIINTICGTTTAGYSGDGIPATTAELNYPNSIIMDDTGSIYITDCTNQRIRKISGHNHPPRFTNGHSQSLAVCENTVGDSINFLLAVQDSDIGQTETWSVILTPVHGSVVAAATAISNGGTVTPAGTYYTPTAGYSGNDSFTVVITDGVSSDTTTMYVTINPTPAAISGTTSIVVSATTTLSDATTGGTWSRSSTSIATVTSGGIVTGVVAGTATITYSLSTGCMATAIVTVNTSGPPTIGCMQFINNPMDTSSWTRSTGSSHYTYYYNDTLVINRPIGSQSSFFYYTDPATLSGTSSTFTVSFDFKMDSDLNPTNPSDGMVFWFLTAGMTQLGTCNGGCLGFPDSTKGFCLVFDTYGPSTPVISMRGLTAPTYPYSWLGGLPSGDTYGMLGTDLENQHFVVDSQWHSCSIVYSYGNITTTFDGGAITMTGYYPITGTGHFGFMATTGGGYSRKCIKNVHSVMNIAGTTNICTGATITLTDASAGGVWSSSNTSVAPIGTVTGIVTGLSPGTSTITYTIGTGCSASTVVTVNLTPSAITGSLSVCTGSTITLSDTSGSGSWSVTGTGVATIGSGTGVVTGVAGVLQLSLILFLRSVLLLQL